MSYDPISPFTKLMTFPSVISVFDKLGTLSDTEAKTGNTNTDSKLEFIVTPTNELVDTLVHKNNTSTATESPASGTTFVASNSNHGYCDPNAPQSTDTVSLDKAESSTCPPSYPIEDSEEDQNSISSEENTQNNSNSELEGCSDMLAHAFVEQSNGYIDSEHGPLCTFDENSHIVEEFLPTVFPEEAAVLQPIPAMMEPEESYIQSSSGCLSDTHVVASVEENPNSLGLQNPDSSSLYIGAEDELSLAIMSSSEQRQYLSTSSGYIKDCSKPRDVPNYSANELTLSCS